MRWPWRRCAEVVEYELTPEVVATPRTDEDERGLDEAYQALDRALSHWPEVTQVSAAIRGIRQRNHLAEKVRDALGGHPR